MHKHRKPIAPRPTGSRALSALTIAAALSAGCAQHTPHTIAHLPSGLRLTLPDNFEDDTPDARRRQQQRGMLNDPDLRVDMAAAFNDVAGGRSCIVNHVVVLGAARPHWETASAVAQRVSSMQSRAMQQVDPWPHLRAGLWLNALPGSAPLTDIVQRSEPGQIGGRPGWLIVTEQTWPERAGPVQGVSRLATLAARLPASGRQTNEWLMAHCQAVHLRDYVPRYLEEALDVLASAGWQPPAKQAAPTLVKAAATVPE